jgi:hypothetical protein
MRRLLFQLTAAKLFRKNCWQGLNDEYNKVYYRLFGFLYAGTCRGGEGLMKLLGKGFAVVVMSNIY